MISLWRRLGKIMLACLLAGSVALALQTRKTVNDGIYTDQQAMRGQSLYEKRCSACHGANLAGRTGPPLAGEDFLSNWGTHPLLELANKIVKTMPRDDSDALTPQESADVLAYILQVGKFPSGRAELILNEDALKNVSFPVEPQHNRSAAVVAPPMSLPASGNLAQVMRGVLFPSANLLFSVQTIDPGTRKPAANAAAPRERSIGSRGEAVFIEDGKWSTTLQYPSRSPPRSCSLPAVVARMASSFRSRIRIGSNSPSSSRKPARPPTRRRKPGIKKPPATRRINLTIRA